MKGQARKAKANKDGSKNNMLQIVNIPSSAFDNNNSLCDHGQETLSDVCAEFITTFFRSYLETVLVMKTLVSSVNNALLEACTKHPEVIANENYLDMVKTSIVSNGTSYLLQQSLGPSHLPLACAVALMFIDSYSPTSSFPSGTIDYRNANTYLRNFDILNGCRRSLVKYYVNQTPCKCLDEMYAKERSTTPKMAACPCCKETKERKSMFICTGCERMQYCSKSCQLEHVSIHKDVCKRIQAGIFDI